MRVPHQRRRARAALKDEQTEKSISKAAVLKERIEALSDLFAEQDRQIFSNVATLTARNAELKTHHQQLVANLQKQLQNAEKDVGKQSING